MARSNVPNENAPVPARLRFEVLRRDGFRCRYCGRPGSESGEGLTVDHVIPRALGGTNDPSNLVAACQDCNAGKSSASPDDQLVADVDESALRWADAIRAAHETASADLSRFDRDTKAFRTAWRKNALGPLPAGWEDSVRRFLAEGFQRSDLLHFLPVIANRPRINEYDHFRYFCGCINGEREKRVTLARQRAEPTQAEPSDDADDFLGWYSVGSALSALMVGPRDLADALTPVLSTPERPSPTPGRLVKHLLDGLHDKFEVRYESAYGPDLNVEGWLASTAGAHASYLEIR